MHSKQWGVSDLQVERTVTDMKNTIADRTKFTVANLFDI